MANGQNILEWKIYDSTTKSTFQNLYTDGDFSDVTLACEGNTKVSAHKVVLSACSDFFKEILKEHPNPYPLIYLQGITARDLSLLKMFMYLGKATVETENMTSFISAAKLFLNKEPKKQNSTMEISMTILNTENIQFKAKTEGLERLSESVDEDLNIETQNRLHRSGELLNHERDILELDQPKVAEKITCDHCDWNTSDRARLAKHCRDTHRPEVCCTKCKFKTTRSDRLLEHDNAKHQRIISSCKICGLTFPTLELLRSHKKENHRNIHKTYPCKHCDYTTKHAGSLSKHKKIHEGTMLLCDECEYRTYNSKTLFDHKEVKHCDNEYICDKCECVVKTKRQLKDHDKSVHKGIRFYCDACDFNTARSDNLRTHERAVHKKEKLYCDFCTYNDAKLSRVLLHMKRKHIQYEDEK